MPTNGISLVTPAMTFLAGLKPLVGRGMITTVKTFYFVANMLRVNDDSVTLVWATRKQKNPQYTIEQVKKGGD